MDRYSRQDSIIAHEELKRYKVCVVGCGGVGTFVAKSLVRMGVGEIHLFDDDRVEMHNLNRQDFREEDDGKPKATTFAKELKKINSDVRIFAENARIIKEDQLPKDLNVIFSCVDTYKSRIMLERHIKSVNQKCIIIDGATIESQPTSGTVLTLVRKQKYLSDNNVEYRDFVPDLGDKLQDEKDTPSCSRNPAPAIIETTQMVAGMMVSLFRQYVNDRTICQGMFLISLGRQPMITYFKWKPKEENKKKVKKNEEDKV